MITLDRLLAEWMPEQRWFAAKGRPINAITASLVAVLREPYPRLEVALVGIGYADGGRERYVVPLSFHREYADHLRHALIGELEEEGAAVRVYDGMHDRDLNPIWTDLIAEQARVGPLTFHPEPGADIPRGLAGDVLVAEQSNTSLVYGEDAILKLFRRLEPGVNPDVEVHDALRPVKNPHIAPLLGFVELDGAAPGALAGAAAEGGDGARAVATVAMLQTFLPVASDGWSLATASVRDLYTERDLHADEVGGDFAGEAHRLGQATASVHADLAQVLPSEPAGPGWLAETADGMARRLAAAAAAVPALASHADTLHASYRAVRDLPADLPLQRVHGDLHLGQVLRTAQNWVLLDFEGEPARPLATRRTLDSPLRDVAGMLRSFDYASRYLLLDEPEDPQLDYRASEWADRNREAFCDGYAEASGADPREQGVLLRAFEADKVVYEAMYEIRNRPHWLPIPLAALDRLATEGSG
jgi:maltokinase